MLADRTRRLDRQSTLSGGFSRAISNRHKANLKAEKRKASEREIERLKLEVEVYQRARFRPEPGEDNISELAGENLRLKAFVKDLSAINKDLTTVKDQQEVKLSHAASHSSDLRSTILAFQKELDDTKKERDELKTGTTRLSKQLEVATSEQAATVAKLAKLTAELDKSRSIVSERKTVSYGLDNKIKQMQKKNREFEDQIVDLERSNALLSQVRDTQAKIIVDFKKDRKLLTLELEQLSKDSKKLDIDKRLVEASLAKLQADHTGALKEMAEVKKVNVVLEDEKVDTAEDFERFKKRALQRVSAQEQEIAYLNYDISKCKHLYEQSSLMCKEMGRQLSEAHDENVWYSKDIDRLRSEKSVLTQINKRFTVERSETDDTIGEISGQLKKLQLLVPQLREKLTIARAELTDLKSHASDHSARLAEKQQELDSWLQQVTELQTDKDKDRTTIRDLRKALANEGQQAALELAQEQHHKKQLQQAGNAKDKQVSALHDTVEDLSAQIRALKVENGQQADMLQSHSVEVRSLEEQVAVARRDAELRVQEAQKRAAAALETKEEHIASLNRELDRLTQESLEAQKETAAHSKELDKKKSFVQKKDAKIKELTDKVTFTNRKFIDQKTAVAQREARIKALNRKLADKDERIASFQAVVEQKGNEAKALSGILGDKDDKIQALMEQRAELEQVINAQKRAIADLEASVKDLQQTKDQLHEAWQQIKDLEVIRKVLQEEVRTLKLNQQPLLDQISELKLKIGRQKKTEKLHEQSLADCHTQIQEMKSEQEKQQQQFAKEKEELHAQLQDKEVVVEAKGKLVEEAQGALVAAEQRMQQLEASDRLKDAKIQELLRQIEGHKLDKEKMVRVRDAQAKSTQAAKDKYRSLEDTILALQDQLQEERKKLASATAATAAEQKKAVERQDEIDTFKRRAEASKKAEEVAHTKQMKSLQKEAEKQLTGVQDELKALKHAHEQCKPKEDELKDKIEHLQTVLFQIGEVTKRRQSIRDKAQNRLKDMVPNLGFAVNADSSSGDVVVVMVTESSQAARAGMKEGDIVLSLNGSSITSQVDFYKVCGELVPGKTLSVSCAVDLADARSVKSYLLTIGAQDMILDDVEATLRLASYNEADYQRNFV